MVIALNSSIEDVAPLMVYVTMAMTAPNLLACLLPVRPCLFAGIAARNRSRLNVPWPFEAIRGSF
jgi:hypothetical protein